MKEDKAVPGIFCCFSLKVFFPLIQRVGIAVLQSKFVTGKCARFFGFFIPLTERNFNFPEIHIGMKTKVDD